MQLKLRVIFSVTNSVYKILNWIFLFIYKKPLQRIPSATNPLFKLSATALAKKIRHREIRSYVVVHEYIERIKEVNFYLNAVVDNRFGDAIIEAKICDEQLSAGKFDIKTLEMEKPLFGVPITIKECCAVKGCSYTGGSMRRKGIKATHDAAIIELIRNAGGIPVCVTNTPELCTGIETTNLLYGHTSNAYDSRFTAGGSSGGEGALLGAGASLIGIGSDLGGSIRLPAAFNGVFGHKPTSRIISTEAIIPTPEVTDLADVEAYDKIYPADYKLPRQLIHMQPFAMEQDIPDYDMDSEDEKWVAVQSRKMDLTPLLFEEMMDRLEKNSGQNAVTLNEAKALLKEDDDLIIAVFDYWLNKRLKTQHPLVLSVKTENRSGSSANNPYIAFRRRTEKMQTRKNRKNDETSYEKMLKLRRDLSRAVTLLEMVKRREKTKREHLHLTIEIYEKRYQAQDFNGQVLAEVSALRAPRPAFAPLFTNQFGVHQNWTNKVCKDEIVPRKEKRQYKKRKHKTDSRGGSLDDTGVRSGTGSGGGRGNRPGVHGSGLDPLSSDEDSSLPSHSHSQPLLPSDRDDEDAADEGQFAFRRNRNSTYLPPVSGGFGNWPWCDKNEGGLADKKYRFALTSISKPMPRCIGLARRRIGRGGRVILDRCTADMDEMWSSLDYTIHDSRRETADTNATATATTIVKQEWPHFRPKTPPESVHSPSEESNFDTDSDAESTVSRSKLPYPFPPEMTSLCIEVEPERATSDEVPFTSEFSIADYFAPDTMSDFEVAVAGFNSTTGSTCIGDLSDSGVNASRTDDELGSSHFVVTPLMNNLFAPPPTPTRPPQCSGGSSVVHTSTSSSSIPLSSSVVACTTNQAAVQVSSTVSTQCAVGIGAAVDVQLNHQPKQLQQHRQLPNNSTAASILSKSLTSPTNNRNGGSCSGNGSGSGSGSGGANIRVFSASTVSSSGGSGGGVGSGSGITNFSNSHQNGPLPHINNSNNLTNSTHVVNNQQSTLVLPQKHPPSNLLPGLIAQNKLASLARQQQQQTQNQAQQAPTSGEITLNSNSESMDMEVDGVDSSPCDSKPQQQQLVRANKTNSLAMEVT